MAAKLVAEEGIQKGLVLSLEDGDEWTLGRDPNSCQLFIEDPSVSRKHLSCKKTTEGIVLENLSSTNPVTINEELIQEPHLLHNGDIVKIGTGLYRFYSEEEAQISQIGDQNSQEINGKEHPMEKMESPEQSPPNEHPSEPQEPFHEEHLESEEHPPIPADQEPSHEEASPEEEHQQEPAIEEPHPESIVEEPHHEPVEEHSEDHISIFEEPAEGASFPEIDFDLMETGRWLFKVVGGPNHGAEFTMAPGTTYTIGTDPNNCDIVFNDTSVSRQHAKVTVNEDNTISLEDLRSRNGTFVDGKPLTGKEIIPANTLILTGTSSFVVYDREGEMQTIISPLLPSIVKVLKEEAKEEPVAPVAAPVEEAPKPVETVVEQPAFKKEHAHEALGAFILIAIITGLFVIIGIGTTTLFRSQPVAVQQISDPEKEISNALTAFPSVKSSFNRSTGRLLLVGHVLTSSDKNQLLYNLQGLNFIRNVDDSGVIIDEGVWREINQILSQNPNWNGISVHSSSPGHFVISGYLKTRKQADQLWDYMSANFPYLDLLEKRVVVEEDVANAITAQFQSHNFKDVSAQMNEGNVVLSGHIPGGKTAEFEKVVAAIKDIPGVRNIRNLVTEAAPEQSIVNITDRYEISGFSYSGSTITNVIINGRILARGDVLDGMTITSIKPNAVFLEKDGVKYRIDYNH